MKTGLLYVAFGSEFDLLASYCVAYSRRFTKLPIQVLTNVAPESRSKKWSEVDDVHFTQINDVTTNNRLYKTSMNEYTIFENTVYLDSDSIIQKPNFDEVVLEFFSQDNDLILNHYCTYPTSLPILLVRSCYLPTIMFSAL